MCPSKLKPRFFLFCRASKQIIRAACATRIHQHAKRKKSGQGFPVKWHTPVIGVDQLGWGFELSWRRAVECHGRRPLLTNRFTI